MITQSKELTAFYREYLAWAEADSSAYHPHFDKALGLCSCLCSYSDSIRPPFYAGNLVIDMDRQFSAAGLSSAYPFDDDPVMYALTKDKTTNEKRMAWVREHAKLGEE